MDFESCSSGNQVTDVMLEGEGTRKKKCSDFQTQMFIWFGEENKMNK